MKDKVKEIEFAICNEINGDVDNCKKTVCDGCSFKLPRLKEAAQAVYALFPKAGEDGLAEKNYIYAIWLNWSMTDCPDESTAWELAYRRLKGLLKAQKALTSQQWIEGIETKISYTPHHTKQEFIGDMRELHILSKDWQDLKSKMTGVSDD